MGRHAILRKWCQKWRTSSNLVMRITFRVQNQFQNWYLTKVLESFILLIVNKLTNELQSAHNAPTSLGGSFDETVWFRK